MKVRKPTPTPKPASSDAFARFREKRDARKAAAAEANKTPAVRGGTGPTGPATNVPPPSIMGTPGAPPMVNKATGTSPLPRNLPVMSGPMGSAGAAPASGVNPLAGAAGMGDTFKGSAPGVPFGQIARSLGMNTPMKKGGKVKAKSKSSYSSGGSVKSSASKRGDGCAQRGKTKGRMV